MAIKRRIRDYIERATHTHIYRKLPHGVELSADIMNRLPGLKVRVVVDVGANLGQSSIEFLRWFPTAQIYCFEPVEDTFRQLQLKLKGYDRIHSFRMALGASRGKRWMSHQGSPDMYRLINRKDALTMEDPLREEVNLDTLDAFCLSSQLDHIGYLKIDTEGADLEVLRGSEAMLKAHRIDLVQVEAGMNCRNELHVPFEALKEFLESRGYFLFGIYHQMPEWFTNQPHLRWSDLVFVSGTVAKAFNWDI